MDNGYTYNEKNLPNPKSESEHTRCVVGWRGKLVFFFKCVSIGRSAGQNQT